MGAVHLWCIFLLSASANLADDSDFRGNTEWARYLVAGRVALDTGNYARAISVYKQALLAIPQTGRENRSDRAFAADGLGLAYSRLGRYWQAEVDYRYALAIWRELSGANTATVAVALSNVGTLCYLKGAFGEARRYYEEALSIDGRIFGAESATIARDLNNVAAVDIEAGKFTRAERLLRRAIEIGRSLQSRDARLAASMRNLAVLFARLHRYRDAVPLYDQILEMQRAEEGPGHPATGVTLNELAHSELGLRKCVAAEGHARQALEILRGVLGEQHPSTGTSYRALGLAYVCQRRPEIAEPLLLRVVQIDEKVEQCDILRAGHLREYAAVLRTLGRKTEAKKFEALAEAARLAAGGTDRRHLIDLKELEAKR